MKPLLARSNDQRLNRSELPAPGYRGRVNAKINTMENIQGIKLFPNDFVHFVMLV